MVVLAILFLAISGCALGSPISSNTKVVGGDDAPEGVFIYQVSLRHSDGNHVCGGSIINSRTILTAGHCILATTPGELNVVVGSIELNEGGQTYSVERLTVHEDYRGGNDIGIIRLSKPIEYSSNIGPIELETEESRKGTIAILSGWGLNQFPGGSVPNNLQYVYLQTVHGPNCGAGDNKLCTSTTSGQGACIGDSGGPLVANGGQIGIVSGSQPCATGWPDYFTNVSSYIDWITKYSS